jgi:hypothetical protein
MNEEKLIDSIIELACELDRGDIKLDELVKEAYALVKKDRAEQLTLTDVGWSEVFTKYGKPFTSGRDLWDWLKDNCKVVLKT